MTDEADSGCKPKVELVVEEVKKFYVEQVIAGEYGTTYPKHQRGAYRTAKLRIERCLRVCVNFETIRYKVYAFGEEVCNTASLPDAVQAYNEIQPKETGLSGE